jgi:AcrR family transcriptional regulator
MKRGRRSEHTRDQLLELTISEGGRLLGEVGLAAFSARELARRIGYSVSTVLGVHGGGDGLAMAINTRTFALWTHALEAALSRTPDDRIAALVGAYFDFACRNPHLWRAIYEHRIPDGALPEDQAEARGRLTAVVVAEVARVVGSAAEAEALTPSLVAVVHGHCHLWVTGAADLMGMVDARRAALDRVRASLDRR